MEKMKFYRIAIKNKKCYLKAKETSEGFEWTNKNDYIYWNEEKEALAFGKKHFKTFTNWEAQEFETSI